MPINKLKHPERDYYQGWNETAQDKELSYAALGLHTYLLSLPNDWEIIRSALQRDGAKTGKINSLITELVEHGLLHHVQTRDENGKLSNTIYWVYARSSDNPHYEPSLLVEMQLTTNQQLQKKEVKKESIKDSSAEKSAEGLAPTTTSDAKKKGEAARAIDWQATTEAANVQHEYSKQEGDDTPEIDWQAKILATLTDDWMTADYLEDFFGEPPYIFDPLAFSEHPAAIALYQLESERKVEYKSFLRYQRRQWRLHSDYGQPAPKSDFDLLKAAIERRLDINNGALLSMTHMLSGTSAKKGTAYYWETIFFRDENACTADDIDDMVDYFVKKCGADATLPTRPEVVSNWIMKARKHKAEAGKEPEMNWDVQPEEPPVMDFTVWGKDETND